MRTDLLTRPSLLLAASALASLASTAIADPLKAIAIQPIVICDAPDVGCTANLLATLPDVLAAANVIFEQAGLVLGAPPVARQIIDPSYKTTTLVQDNGNPTDEMRTLLRNAVPSLGLSSNSTVLNVVFVDAISEVRLDGTPTGANLAGFGFVNANGIVITAGARLDTLAHEIGHNLGLNHTDIDPQVVFNDPLNLMTKGAFRSVPPSVAGIKTGASYNFDRLVTSQITQLNNPQFTLNLAQVVGAADGPATSECRPGVRERRCFYFEFSDAPTSEKLRKVTANFATQGLIADGVLLLSDLTAVSPEARQGPGDTQQLIFDLGPAGLTEGNPFTLLVRGAPFGSAPVPLSLFFEFDNGVVARGLYDADGSFNSANPYELVFLTQPPAQTIIRNAIEGDAEPAADVPEPGTLGLLAAMGSALALRRRSGKCPATQTPGDRAIHRH